MRADAKALIGKSDLPTNPALNTGLAATFVTSVFVLINTLWPNLMSDKLEGAILSVVVILAPIIVGWLIRFKVWSPESVRQVIMDAKREGAEEVTIRKADDDKPPAPKLL